MKVLNIEIYIPEKELLSKDSKEFRKCLSQGYFVYDRKEGYNILRKKPQILVTIEHEGQVIKRNLKFCLAEIYGKKINDKKLIELFKEDLRNHKVTLKKDSKGYFYIVKK